MKQLFLTLILCLIATPAFCGNYICWSDNSYTTNDIDEWYHSVDGTSQRARNDCMQVTSADLATAKLAHKKVTNGVIVGWGAQEIQDETDALEAASIQSEIDCVEDSTCVTTDEMLVAWEDLYPEEKEAIINQIKTNRGLQ